MLKYTNHNIQTQVRTVLTLIRSGRKLQIKRNVKKNIERETDCKQQQQFLCAANHEILSGIGRKS